MVFNERNVSLILNTVLCIIKFYFSSTKKLTSDKDTALVTCRLIVGTIILIFGSYFNESYQFNVLRYKQHRNYLSKYKKVIKDTMNNLRFLIGQVDKALY